MLITARGFTLVELMIVVTIITLVGGIAAPALLSQLPDYRLKGTTRSVFASLQYAKMSAASSGKEHRVQFLLDPVPQRYQLQQGNYFSGSDNWKNVLAIKELPPQVWIDHATDYRGTHQTGISIIAFNPTGTASSGGIYLENSRGSLRSLKVSSTTGRIRIANDW